MPQHVPCGLHRPTAQCVHQGYPLCLSTFHADCIRKHSSYTPRTKLCLSTFHADCIVALSRLAIGSKTLPQHVPCGLHQIRLQIPTVRSFFASARSMRIASANMHKNIRGLCKTCCELVDSFSDTQKFVSALAIFPYPSAAKATYVAICGSLGRTIDRFCGANCT